MNFIKDFVLDAVRNVFATLDWIMFCVLDWVYQLFFDITTVEFISGKSVAALFARVQLILGVFMVFKLTVSVLKAIINPDLLGDKNNGSGAIVKRVLTCLIMLAMIVPLNINNPSNKFEIQVNNNGILFGTLYSLQERVLENNTIGKLILNDSSKTTAASSNESQAKNLKAAGKEFVSTIVHGMITVKDGCSVDGYDSADHTELLTRKINTKCSNGEYALNYFPLIGGVVAIAFAVILIGFSVDIVVRSLKIAFLRLLAPIPIMSYLDPNQEKKGAYANWVKLLTATYLDLFIRLAIIYFVLFLIQEIRTNGVVLNIESDGMMMLLVYLAICFGLFVFAKQAPKFITDMLGVQGMMQNVGLSAILGGAAMGLGGGGLAGIGYGMMNGAKQQMDGAAQGKAVPLMSGWSQNRDLMAKIRTGDKDAQGGLFGRTQDYLNYKTREHRADQLSIGKKDLAIADYEKDQRKAAAGAAQRKLDMAELKLKHTDKSDPNFQNVYNEYVQAYNENSDAQSALEKAAKAVDAIDKQRGQSGVGPTIESLHEEHSRTPLKVTEAKIKTKSDGSPVMKNGSPVIEYTFKKDAKEFNGTIDDSFGSSSGGTGAGTGGHGGHR